MVRHLHTSARLVVGAAPSALAFSFLIASLTVTLNPESTPGLAGFAVAWMLATATYGVALLVGFPLAVAAVRFFAARPLRLTWLHAKSIVWFMVAGGALAIGAFGYNLGAGGDLLSESVEHGLRRALVALSACWIAGTLLAASAQALGSGSGSGRFRWALLALCAGLPASILGWSSPPPQAGAAPPASGAASARAGSVVILAVEGATFSEILPLVSEGRLPAFAELLRTGSHGPLATLRPCRSAAAWSSLSTGRRPSGHGVRDGSIYALPGLGDGLRRVPEGIFFRKFMGPAGLRSRDIGPDDLLSRPAWEILDRSRVPATFVAWPLAEPAPPVRPSEEGSAEARRWLEEILPSPSPGLDPAAERALAEALSDDARIAGRLLRLTAPGEAALPRLVAVRFAGLEKAAAAFARHLPGPEEEEEPGGEPAEYANVLTGYYEVLDGVIGSVRTALSADDYLIVISPYGRERLTRIDRLVRRSLGRPRPRLGHESGPAGILVLAGPGVSEGRQVDDLRITDALPLALYLLGLPVGRDMDGVLPRRLLTRPFLESHPISFVASHG